MIRAFQWDLARQVERLDVLLGLLPRYAEWGYQELYLHLEDAVEYPSFPEVARADAYSRKEFALLVEAAARAGISVVPIINLLGHTQYLIKTERLRDLNELRAADGSALPQGQVCPLHPQMTEVAERLLRDVAPFCTAGKVHVGLDESFHIGKCPRCREEVARLGLAGHFAGHVSRMHAVARHAGLRMGMWADMLNFIPEAIPLLPEGAALYDWYYYPFKRHPRVELYNFAECDLATPLRARGLEYWGCPMNGAFRYEPLPVFSDRLANLRAWWERCGRVGAGGFLVTSWEAYRLSLAMTTAVDAAAASLWLDGGAPDDDEAWLRRGFERAHGKAGALVAARAALDCDRHPFSGYARWEANLRWSGFPAGDAEGDAAAEAVEKHLRRVALRPLPKALAECVEFRIYLAAREAYVRRCVAGVCGLRQLAGDAAGRPRDEVFLKRLSVLDAGARGFSRVLRKARQAAQAMWRRSRDPKAYGQNEVLLDGDEARLREWNGWLLKVRMDAAQAWSASPVFGAWQLQFTVHNFAPAVQKVAVERRAADGGWRELAARHTIEFVAEAAEPRANIRRSFAVPVDSAEAELRIGVHGIGQVAIEGVALTDGVKVLKPAERDARRVLGRPAPASGFPDPSARAAEEEWWGLEFRA